MTDAELNALFARARARQADTSRQEYAFETRLMAQIREKRAVGTGSIWAKVAWQMMPIFATCVLALAILQTHMTNVADESAVVSALDNPEGVVLSGLN